MHTYACGVHIYKPITPRIVGTLISPNKNRNMAWDRNGDLTKKKVAHWRCNGHI